MALFDLVSPDRAAELAAMIGSAAVKSTLVLIIGAGCAIAARRASAATRHLIWALALGAGLAVPVIAALAPSWHIAGLEWQSPIAATPVLRMVEAGAAGTGAPIATTTIAAPSIEQPAPQRVRAAPKRVSRAKVVEPAPIAEVVAAPAAEGVVVVEPAVAITSAAVVAPTGGALPMWIRLAPWLLATWVLGVIIAFAPTLVAQTRLASLRRRAHPVRGGRWALLIPSALREIDVRRRVRFLELDGAAMPMTWGIWRPIVLLPEGDFDSTVPQRLDVLRHELAHVRRYDCLTQLVAQLSCAVWWFNPLSWLAARQLRIERERACDDEVLRAGAKPSDYAGYLLRVARSMHVRGAAAYGGLAMARPSQLAGRLLAVLDHDRPRGRLSSRVAARAITAASVAVIAIASLSVTAEAADSATLEEPVAELARAVTALGQAVAELETFEAPLPPNAAPTVAVAATELPAPAAVPLPSLDAGQIVLVPRITTPLAAPTIAAAVASAAPPVVQPAAPCDPTARPGKRNTSTNMSSSRDGSKRWQVIWRQGDCSYEIDARGEITYNRDVTDIETISRGGSFTIEQEDDGDTRRLVVRPNSDGTLDRQYSVNGSRRAYDADARAWLAESLVALDRQTAFAVDYRVPAILERGGVDAVFQEITRLASDYARRRYYTKLLATRTLDRAQIRRVVEQAGDEMESDYELAELLIAASKLDAFGDDSHAGFVTASKTIGSDYERRRVLDALLQRDQLAPATVESLLDAASTIKSDYELAELLIDVSKRYAINDQTRPTYIKAVGSIKSDYEHRRVLSAIVAGGGLNAPVTRALLEDARRIESDYELAEFLIQVAQKGTLDPTSRDAYFAAADKIKSDYEQRRALSPLVKRDVLTKDLARSVLASAAKIDSDYEAATLLVAIANAITIDDDLRPAFEKAADTIQGQYEYGRAMSSIRRRATR